MQGIILDLEIAAIPFDSLTQAISKFSKSFYTAAKKSNLKYSIAIYGDTFYRARPYDVKILAQNADTIMIMAYDLHKAKSNPGPNFPLHGREKFGYDFTAMTDDFLKVVPSNKITVIFGSFGYDWQVDQSQTAQAQAQALTYSQIKQKFLNQCSFKNCKITRDRQASETRITYEEDNKNHVIWFEDPQSIKQKQNYLKQKGITSFSYWAYSYF
jgi:spore germination protein YaaH